MMLKEGARSAESEDEMSETYTQGNQLVSSRIAPWMKVGTVVDGHLTAAEAARQGGLDFTVSLREIQYAAKNSIGTHTWLPATKGTGTKEVSRRMVVADDTNEWMEAVSGDYPIIQYGQAFDFLDALGAKYVAAGTLYKRRQGFMVAQLPNLDQLALLDGEDPHDIFLIIRTSHDRTRAMEVAVMALRGKCMNQLPLATFTKTAKQRWSIPHYGNVTAKLKEIQGNLTNTLAYCNELREISDRLAAVQLEEEAQRAILTKVLGDKPKTGEKIEIIISNTHDAERNGYAGTGWGLVNAVSEHMDWQRILGTPESRFLGALQGQTYRAINRTAALVLSRA